MEGKRKIWVLMLYTKKNVRLTLVFSVGAAILVSAMSIAGGFSYFSVKRSMSLVVDESPVDFMIIQKDYGPNARRYGPTVSPSYIGGLINSVPHVNDLTIVALGRETPNEVRVFVDRIVKGSERICVVGLWSRNPINLTLSQGVTPNFSSSMRQDIGFRGMLVSDDLFQKYNMSIGSNIKLDRGWNPELQKADWEMWDSVVGVVEFPLSQLIEELGIQDVIDLAGFDKAKLVFLDEFPFVIAHLPVVDYALPFERMPTIYFMKFDKEAYMNPWDINITQNNLEELGEELLLNVNNASSQRINMEFDVASGKYWPTISSLEQMRGFVQMNIVTILAFGFTLTIVGWYFYSTLTRTIIVAKAGELQLLYIRGASPKTISASVTFLAALASILGTIIGLTLGSTTTVYLAPTVLGVTVTSEDISVAFGGVSMLLYCLFGILAYLLSHRTVLSRMKACWSLQKQEEPGPKERKGFARTAILALAFMLGTAKAIEWILGVHIFTLGQTTNPITSALIMLVELIDKTVLDTLAAIFLVYAFVSIISMKPGILSRTSYTISRFLSPTLALLSRKLMHSKSLKMIGSMIITSLLIFNIVSVNMGHAGITAAWEDLSVAIVGADIRIDMQEEAAPHISEALDNIAGAGNYTQILLIKAAVGPPLGGTPIYIIETNNYTTIVNKIDPSFMNLLKTLNRTGILVSQAFHDIGALDNAKSVQLENRELLIVGFIEYLPGTFSIPPLGRFAVADIKVVEDVNYTILSRTILVRTWQNKPEHVLNALIESFPSNISQSYTAATVSSAMSEFSRRLSVSRIGENVMTLLSFASLASFSFAIGAIGIVAYNDAMERRRLDALFRIRGLRRLQLLNLILSEALSFFFFSLLIGLFAGFVMASGYNAYFSATFPIRASPSVSPMLLVELFSLFAIYLLVFLAPSVLAMRRTPRFHDH